MCVQAAHRIRNSLTCLYSRLQCTHTRAFLGEAPCRDCSEDEATCYRDSHLFLPAPMSPLHPLFQHTACAALPKSAEFRSVS
jgi:hypothetical protein